MIFINSNYKNKILKSLQNMNLINSFLFDSSMENTENAKFIAKTIVKRATGRVLTDFTVETQREYKGIETDKRGIRLDVLISVNDSKGKTRELYDIEPNDYKEPNIAKRTRYYNALTDVKHLNIGEDFTELPEMITIWILTDDPFGANKMIYTVKNIVTDSPDLEYNDGVTNLFLYTKGEIGGSEELKHLLHHMTDTTADNALDSELKQIQNIVDSVKSDREVGERYMSMEKIMKSAEYHGFKAGEEKGMAQGMAQAIQIFVEALYELDIPQSQIKEKLLKKFNLSESEADEYLKNVN